MFEDIRYRIAVVFLLCLMLAFAHEYVIFHHPWAIVLLLVLLFAMSYEFKCDPGMALLLAGLIMLSAGIAYRVFQKK